MGRYQQDGGIEGITLICLLSNNNLTAIQGQKHLCESFELQVGDCKTLVESNTEEGILRSQAPAQVADSPTMVPQNSSVSSWTQL